MDIKIRNVDPVVIRKMDEAARKKKISREEYLRRMINRTAALDDVKNIENKYTDLVEKVAACIRAQNDQLKEIRQALLGLDEMPQENRNGGRRDGKNCFE